MKNGVIADLDAAESVVRLAVDAAERMAGLTIDSLIVNISAGRLQSDIYTASIDLGGQEVDAADLQEGVWPPPASSRCARTASSCIRCRPASRSTASAASAIRWRCSAMRWASTCTC